jgi:hypothetical protein
MEIYLNPYLIQMQADEYRQLLMREAQDAAASQRRMMQQLGIGLHWLGQQFVRWGQQFQLRSALQDNMEVYHGHPTA